ncbi:MAG: transposase [Chitinophagaceae bacterium]
MGNQKREFSQYSEEFKWRVVQTVLSGDLSKEEARVAYGIKSNCGILYWMRKYSGNDDYRNIHTMSSNLAAMHDNKESNALKDRIKQLEAELRRANLRADLWQTMIEVAEKQLKIDIKKKSGAQPLKYSGKGRRHQK